MNSATSVLVHESAAPHAVRASLLEALRRRELHAKFLYLGLGQTLRWIALHEAHSPARRDPDVVAIYDRAFEAAGQSLAANVLHLVGLAAGSAHKEVTGIQRLRALGKSVFFSPLDASLEILLSGHHHAATTIAGLQTHPILCDLPACASLPALLKQVDPGGSTRLITFFGAIHNFLPAEVLTKILHIVRGQDLFLIAANLAPEQDYLAALDQVFPQYDNEATRAWLLGGLEQAGVPTSAGRLTFVLAPLPGLPALRRIEARFTFEHPWTAQLFGETVAYEPGESILAFSSGRYTATSLPQVLASFGFATLQTWVSPRQDEATFLCRRA